jgi:hypothetical protein
MYFWATATAGQKNQGPRGDFPCKQQQLRNKNPATQESYCSNVDYIAGSMKQLRKSTTTRASMIKKMVRMAHWQLEQILI